METVATSTLCLKNCKSSSFRGQPQQTQSHAFLGKGLIRSISNGVLDIGGHNKNKSQPRVIAGGG
jgi:hypothetical protein